MKKQTQKEIDRRIDEYFGMLVKITWGDAHGSHFIKHLDNIRELVEIEYVGWIIYQDKEVVTVSSFKAVNYPIEFIDDIPDKFRYYIVIPRRTIWKVRRL